MMNEQTIYLTIRATFLEKKFLSFDVYNIIPGTLLSFSVAAILEKNESNNLIRLLCAKEDGTYSKPHDCNCSGLSGHQSTVDANYILGGTITRLRSLSSETGLVYGASATQ